MNEEVEKMVDMIQSLVNIKGELKKLGEVKDREDNLYGIDENLDGANFKINQAIKTLQKWIGSEIYNEVTKGKN